MRKADSTNRRRVRQVVPRDRYQRALWLALCALVVVSCLRPPYADYLLLQHAPTLPLLLGVGWWSNRFRPSRASFTMVAAFLALHTIGARYLYSYTPYDDWSQAVFGFRINEACGFTRNHYDRLVHFSYGLLLAVPIREFEIRSLGLRPRLASILAVECILATSAAYELVEWLVAETFTPDYAESFLGQQGDPFDAQRDMALATAGAIVAMVFVRIGRPRQTARDKSL